MENITINKGIIERIRNREYYASIVKLMEKDNRVCYITCDGLPEGSMIRNMVAKFPDRIIDVGIAEQNLIGVAAGMALSGKRPLVESMSSFLVMRALDQIHLDLAYNNACVRLLGTNNGTSGGSGPTHDSICDIAILNSVPNMAVVVPADMTQFWHILYDTLEVNQPIYFRMPRFEDPIIYKNIKDNFNLGQADVLKMGRDITIIVSGKCVYYALQAADILQQNYHLDVGVINLCSIKPLDSKGICEIVSMTGRVLTVEDHNIEGGIGTLIAANIAQNGIACQFYKLGITDEFAIFGPREDIAKHYCFDVDGIVKTVKMKFTF